MFWGDGGSDALAPAFKETTHIFSGAGVAATGDVFSESKNTFWSLGEASNLFPAPASMARL